MPKDNIRSANIPLHLVPAYGRDYRTEAEALSDWKRGLDFKILDTSSPWHGAYCSCRDFTRAESVMIRYHRTKFVITGGLKTRPKHGGSTL